MLNDFQFVQAFFVITILLNMVVIATLKVSGVGKHHRSINALLLSCVCLCLYQLTSWLYHESTNISDALFYLRLQSAIMIAGAIVFFHLVLTWTRTKMPRVVFASYVLLSVVLLILNFTEPGTIRYTGSLSFVSYELFSGETVSKIKAQGNPWILAYHAVVIAFLIYLMYPAIKAFKRRHAPTAIALSITLILQIACNYNGMLMDNADLKSIYIAGLPITFMNLYICFFIISMVKTKTRSLAQETGMRKDLEKLILGLAKGVSSANSNRFYINMLSELQKVTGASMSFIAGFEEHNKMSTKAIVYRNRAFKNLSFTVDDSIKALVATKDKVEVKQHLRRDYPHISLFKRLNITSYVAVPMFDDSEQLSGNLVLLFDAEHSFKPHFLRTLEIFTSRAGAEISRDKAAQRIAQLGFTDYQTGLPNSVATYANLETRFSKNIDDKQQSALILFQINKVTELYRHFGMVYAEQAFEILGKRFKEYVSSGIYISRLGSADFSLVIDDLGQTHQGLIRLHWEAIVSLVKKPIEVGALVIRLNCSGAAVIFPQQTSNSNDVMRCAEIALAQSKQKNGSTLEHFNPQSLEVIDRKEKLINMLTPALNSNTELYAVFQPKVNTQGEILGSEALIRWENPSLGHISPVEFIALAEESALVDEIGTWMLRKVCETIKQWQDQGYRMTGRVAINVSPYQLAHENFVPHFFMILREYGISPGLIEIEITESLLLTNLDDCIDKLKELRMQGLTIALDDFGTGYSSLSYLGELPLDVLKIDRSFVSNLHKRNTFELTKAIISVGQHLNLKVVAEGAETKEQVDILSELGCDIFQGFYFARPMLAKELVDWSFIGEKQDIST